MWWACLRGITVVYHRPLSNIYGGAQRVIVDTYEALSVRGFDVTLVSVVPPHRKGRGRAYKFSFRYIEVVECPLTSPFI